MNQVWADDRAVAFRKDAIVRLAVLNKAVAEGRESRSTPTEVTELASIQAVVPDWSAGPVVVIAGDGSFTEYAALTDLPAEWPTTAQVVAAVDLYWWAHQRGVGTLLVTRLVSGPDRRAS